MGHEIPNIIIDEMVGRARRTVQRAVSAGAREVVVLGVEEIRYQVSSAYGSARARIAAIQYEIEHMEDSAEREFWLYWFTHYLPRKLLTHYMDGTGATLTLTPQEMIDCNAVIDITRAKGWSSLIASNAAEAKIQKSISSETVELHGPAGAMTNGTLGNFTVYYKGTVVVLGDGRWVFRGTMRFYDEWDFDPKPFNSKSGRTVQGEVKTRIGTLIRGRKFLINSAEVPFSQASEEAMINWAGGTPTSVPDRVSGADQSEASQ